MVADMVAFVASQFTTSTWDVGAQELCSVVLIRGIFYSVETTADRCRADLSKEIEGILSFDGKKTDRFLCKFIIFRYGLGSARNARQTARCISRLPAQLSAKLRTSLRPRLLTVPQKYRPRTLPSSWRTSPSKSRRGGPLFCDPLF